MPELPEVETTRRGIAPHAVGQTIKQIIVRQPKLRWPVPDTIHRLTHATIDQLERRAKYILLRTPQGTALLHLGMSGSLRVCPAEAVPEKHDHVDIVLTNALALRLRDPRRFGAVLYAPVGEPHALLNHLGPEPLSEAFTGDYLYQRAQGRRVAVKLFIMNAPIVVGVGNIYANEALFMAGIDPRRAAGEVSLVEYERLVHAIRSVLQQAIAQGGTTLRDFVREDGQTGYFQIALQVYGRSGENCVRCGEPLSHIRQGQRSTWYCPACQR